jgi:endonuclease/exonuclease/phosphatase family metal-dependent hydrolase
VTDTLDVVSFNVRNGWAFDGCNSWPFRRGATAAVLRELDADLIGLQEVYAFQLRSLLRRVPGYVAVGEGRNGGRRGEHTPVLARGHVVSHVTRWFELEGGRFPRIATTALVEIGGRRLRFSSTHLDEASPQRRRASVDQLVSWLAAEEGPHVIAGDFNDTLDDPMFEALGAAGYRSALAADAGDTSHHFTGSTEGRPIDHIFVPTNAEVVHAAVVHLRPNGRLPSDHWPVLARIRL